MQLSKKVLPSLRSNGKQGVPSEELFSLPEKVLQFGTGVLLRGLPDYFIDKANRQGIFNGRIVVVKSTAQGGTDAFAQQDNLYTICIRGIDKGQKVDETMLNSSISRVLSASDEWAAVLACAANPQLQVVISNTTEVGITLVKEDKVDAAPPSSFPGKLLAFLLERYKKFNGIRESGLVIIPTELIPGNGTKLKGIVLELAKLNNLPEAFVQWIESANDFCNSLVDRIVPGKLPAADVPGVEERVGYSDELMIMSEVYRLWAIETADERTREILSFSKADPGVIIAPQIDKFRELKLRLLNGSHTFTCGLAVLAGFTTVKQAMENTAFSSFITNLMQEEIVPAISGDVVPVDEARQFANAVLDRYRNPFIEHQWLSICLQYTSKMKMRNLPTLQWYYEKNGGVPQHMALGLAAWLLFMGKVSKKEYSVNDDYAAHISEFWQSGRPDVKKVLQDESLWGASLDALPGLTQAVEQQLQVLESKGAATAIKNFESKKIAS
ncbi:MAG: tagaturonate reductase [Bacteroidetes bacterium]|nr:tagaturonate reductase [Bacteroidota bacterium]